ncbi:hypothetical protein [Sphingomonas ginkgonis]|uniref:hypothetical protein n=1 Tax=Sphingomonas ginkgonis TaxID=2315330 RepID=UPI000F85F9BC|nr:hypothetical protein [Sphingomonas ginkgonis]
MLASLRGGFDLPNGLRVAMAVVSEARIDGQLVLRSQYSIQESSASLSVAGADGSGGLATVSPSSLGPVAIEQEGNGTRIRFADGGTYVSTLIGDAAGTVIQNQADGRAIDVATTIDLKLAGANMNNLGTALPRIDELALATANLLSR